MKTKSPASVDTTQAERIWAEYQATHDVSGLRGKTAGIDPITGNVWIGDSILDVVKKRDAAGIDSLLLFIRIGSRYYYSKRWRE